MRWFRLQGVWQWGSLLLVGFILGLLAGWFLFQMLPTRDFHSVRETSADYRFINPLLFVETPERESFPQLSSLKQSIDALVDGHVTAGDATDISVYFRNLNASQWIAVNPDATFSPASMLKVVTMISVLRAGESDPQLLKTQVEIAGDPAAIKNKQVDYAPQDPVVPGRMYRIDDLLRHLIVQSDNVANHALYQLVGEEKINKTYADFQLPVPGTEDGNRYTTREYSHLFRALYNGTYLSRPLSERVLELLSQADFKNGIVAGVPVGTVVSHKFGVGDSLPEHIPGGVNGTRYRELHDCGIVYYPEHPYFLCVMTRGTDLAQLEKVIQSISKQTWTEVTKLNQ